MVDIVYTIGNGSRWNNNELRYSLRSVEKHLRRVGQVFIVGVLPDFVQNVIHIDTPDRHKREKEWNIFDKICSACEDDRLSDTFLFMNDDHFLLQDEDAGAYPYYYSESIYNKLRRGSTTTYKISINNTYEVLKKHHKDPLYYDIHAPILYDKTKFLELNKYDWKRRCGYVIKSLYCNTHGVSGAQLNDCKISIPMTREGYEGRIKDRPVFSIADAALSPTFEKLLNDLYPQKSKWEK